MRETTRRTMLGGIAAGSALLLGGVGAVGADEDDREETAGLRVAHASPDAPAVDVLVDGAVAVSGLEFRSVTDYLELPTGEYEIAVNVAGTDDTVFGPVDVELAAEDYTAVALGEVGSDDTEFTVSLLEDTNGANIADDEVRVRVVHASPDAPAVDVTVNDGAATLFDGVAFGDSSGYAVVPVGEYDVEVRGDTETNDGDVVFEVPGLTLQGGATYTVFAVGYLTPDDEDVDEPFGLVPTLDASAPPRGGDDEEEAEEAEEEEAEEEEAEEEEAEEAEEEDENGGPPWADDEEFPGEGEGPPWADDD